MASTKAKIGFIKGNSIIDVAELPSLLPKGTAINPTGSYDKIYFNTSLSVDEVVNIMDKLDFLDLIGNGSTLEYYIYANPEGKLLHIYKQLNDNNSFDYFIYLYDNSSSSQTYYFDSSVGWKTNGVVDLQLINGLSKAPDSDYQIGQQNELLSSLISSTSFESAKEINSKALYRLPDGTLWYYYNGKWNAVGGGSSNGIIEVDTLPTENINTEAIYKTPEKFVDSYIHDTYESGLLSNAYNVESAEVVKTKPTSNIVESTMSALHLYYVTDENDIFLYMNIGAGATWYSASQILSANGLTGLTFKGVLLEGETPNENGYYAYYSPKKLYKYNNNKFNEIDGVNATINNLFNGGRITEKLEINYPNELRDGDFNYINVDYLKLILSNTTSFENEKYINVKTSFFTAKFKTLYLTHIDRDVYLNFYNTASFGFCNNLKSLVLDFGVFKPISGSVFSNSTIAEGTGFVYVPDDKVNEVKALSGWSNYASQIKPLSEYKED